MAATLVIASLCLVALPAIAAGPPEKVIIDTDIGSDIDDAFFIAVALRSPEIKILGFTTASGDTLARAQILERMLGESGHENIPVAVGRAVKNPLDPLPGGLSRERRYGESGNFARASLPSAAQFILQEIHRYPEQITLIAEGPFTNLSDVIDKDPGTFHKLKRVVIMGGWIGSVYNEYFGEMDGPNVEFNVGGNISAAQKLFRSGVQIDMMTYDATADLKLDEIDRDILFSQSTPLTDSLTVLYHLYGARTPGLYDAMTVAFMIDPKLCPVRPMHIRVDAKGITHADAGPANAEVCIHSDAHAFMQFYMRRMVTRRADLEAVGLSADGNSKSGVFRGNGDDR